MRRTRRRGEPDAAQAADPLPPETNAQLRMEGPSAQRPAGKGGGSGASTSTGPTKPTTSQASWWSRPVGASADRPIRPPARLRGGKLTHSPEASRAALLRRVSLDLTGDHPRRQRELGVARPPDAYERVVDRLLASPHYGERWARPWLDLARYADTNGYEKDNRRDLEATATG